MDRDDLKAAVDRATELVFEDDIMQPRRPHPRLREVFGLDTSYWKREEPFRLLLQDPADPLSKIAESLSAPDELFWAGLRLFGESLLTYCGPKSPRHGPLRYYPGILMTFWTAFEAFVRLYSEILVQVKTLPALASATLLENEQYLDSQGNVRERRRQQPVLQRYWLLLRYGYGLDFDRGGRIWQAGESALDARNRFVHYEVSSAPSITTSELWAHLEAILLLLIAPSTLVGRTVFSFQYEIHGMLLELRELIEDFEERPGFKGTLTPWTGYGLACSFIEVDEKRYPPWKPPFVPKF